MKFSRLFDESRYIPTLGIRPSAMKALEFLPDRTKDNMTPVVLLSPWVSAKTLDAAMQRFQTAYRNRKFVLDIDRDYESESTSREAYRDFMSLMDKDDCYLNWQKFWKDYDNVIPCVQYIEQDKKEISTQIKKIRSMNRNFCVRANLYEESKELGYVFDNLSEGIADFVIVIEAGREKSAIDCFEEFKEFISTYCNKIESDIPIVISCTTFLKDFTKISGVEEIKFSNNELLLELRKVFNRKKLLYGDWGSANPRTNQGGGGNPIPCRIDYPLLDSWLIARNQEENWCYKDAANEIMATSDWSGKLGVWGEYMIENTANDDTPCIDSAPKNVSSRINLHLHRQALRHEEIEGIELEDTWED